MYPALFLTVLPVITVDTQPFFCHILLLQKQIPILYIGYWADFSTSFIILSNG
jgi:hypothetical protein